MSGRSPIIVIGMHRSGTSLASGLLQRAGVCMGWLQDENRESTLFRALNGWILEQAGASWDRPEPVRDFMACGGARELAARFAADVLRSAQAMSVMGPGAWLRHRNLFDYPRPWGWKDPRNTFTLPLWLDLFPEAKVIHVVRHGVDVAASLRARTRATFAAYRAWRPASGTVVRLMRYWRRPILMPVVDSVRSWELEGAFDLWTVYVEEARRHVAALGSAAAEIPYEELLVRPHETLAGLARFCGLESPEARVAAIAQTIDGRRAFAYREDAELAAFADSKADTLHGMGFASN